MTAPEDEMLRRLALCMLVRHAGQTTGVEAPAAAADRAYDDLARVLAPLIGDAGVKALTDRAFYLAGRDYPCLARTLTSTAEGKPTRMGVLLEGQDPAEAARAATAVFAAFLRLLVTFIGEPLAGRLVQQAWPEVPSRAGTQET